MRAGRRIPYWRIVSHWCYSNGKQKNPPGKSTIIQTVFPVELDHQPLLQIVWRLPHNLRITILEDVIPPHFNLAIPRLRPHCRLAPKVDQFAPKVTLILRHIRIQGRRKTGVIPGGRLCIVINEIDAGRRSETHFPAGGKWPKLRDCLGLQSGVLSVGTHNADNGLSPWVNPCSRPGIVINIVSPPFGGVTLFPSCGKRPGAGCGDVVAGSQSGCCSIVLIRSD